jgi:glucose-1-phosphate adenylyltransferase
MYQGKRIAAVELMGGRGERLWPLVEPGVQSKATLRVAGKRLAYFNADLIQDAGIEYLFLPVQKPNDDEIRGKLRFEGYRFEKVFVTPRSGYLQESETPRFRGTADSVLQFGDLLTGFDYLLIVPCDHITNVNLGELMERAIYNWDNYGAVITTAAMEKDIKEIAKNLGNPKIDNNGKVIAWEEKPQNPISNLGALGIYAGPTEEILNAIKKSGHDFGTDVLKYLRGQGSLYCHFYPGEEYYWNDVGTFPLVKKAIDDFIEGRAKNVKIPLQVVDMETKYGGLIEKCLVPLGNQQPKVHGRAKKSQIGFDAVVGKGVTVNRSILMGENTLLNNGEAELLIEDSILGRHSDVSDTSLKSVYLGRGVSLHNCKVGPEIGIGMDKELFNEGIEADVGRGDG